MQSIVVVGCSMQDQLLPSVFKQKSGARRLYQHRGETQIAFRPVLRLGNATPAATPPMQRHFRSIQSVSDQAQDFSGLTRVSYACIADCKQIGSEGEEIG
jgi:hypothetical protein